MREMHSIRFFANTRLKLRLRRLRDRRQRYHREYSAELAKARSDKKPADEIERLTADWHAEFDLIKEEIGDIETSLIIREGEKYDVHIPIQHGNYGVWEEGRAYTDRYLSSPAIAEMRTQIRKERRERWEEWTRWIPLLSALTGVIGAIIGVLSFLYKH